MLQDTHIETLQPHAMGIHIHINAQTNHPQVHNYNHKMLYLKLKDCTYVVAAILHMPRDSR